ncbi:MAG: hypothetical protein QME64_01035, partial [bacterium]|nr:hypothetical protein [bacterium]
MSTRPFKKIFGWLVFFGIIGGLVYFFWEPGKDIVNRIIGQYKPAPARSPEQAAGAFGIAVDQAADGFTGATHVGALQRAKAKITTADLTTIRNAIYGDFYIRFNRLPNDLDELLKAGSISGGSALNDPWGTKYQSKSANNK